MSTSRMTHPVNVSYLVVGLVFLGISASWALRQAGIVDLAEVRWLLPLTLVVAGAVGLVAATVKGLSRRDETPEAYVYPGDPGDLGYDATAYDTESQTYDDLPVTRRDHEGEAR